MTRHYYVNGNTIRELDAPVRRDSRTRKQIEESRKRKNRRNAARRNRQRAMEMSRGYVVFLTVCVLIIAATSAMFVQMQSQMTSRMRSVANLQSQVINLQADNDARYKSITSSVDMNYVKDVAINQLGMTYPKEDQVVYYTIENNNFMDQYSDIPK
jgi:cell division protein FtsL